DRRMTTLAPAHQRFVVHPATPAAANRSLPVLSVILKGAEALGHRANDSNPCVGIKRHRLQGRSRFLTSGEMRRLGAALDAHAPRALAPVAVVRLLLLTGARQGEVRGLQWRDYREGNLYLPDGKTGPRTVWLSSAARSLLDSLQRNGRWMFPKRCGSEPMSTETLYHHWRILQKNADLNDVRLHDLRHSYASFALRRGETILTIGRLLGHRDPNTTLRYLHFADPLARQSTETVGSALAE
ncbi:MAG: site-specific integrase, partial [Gammaproteobacteria bacterium]|nr:site-specific integrase [Gammaproteobacteria bacterium]